ncbi:MAG: hypothetical protein V8R82_02505 [Clostridia bacterium]
MKKIGFIGVYDKTDMMLNLAKILTAMGKNVLVVDSTLNQKARYVVPAIDPTVSYITSFEDIDVAVGFESLENIKNYIGTTRELSYDIALIDIDNAEEIEKFQMENANINYFVTSFDVYSLKKGLEILMGVKTPMNLTKILYSKDMLKEEDDYLNFLSLGCKVEWNDMIIYFPIENGDLSVLAENQRVQKIKLKKLSVQYKDSLIFIAQQILGEKTDSNIRRVEKALEKGA